MGWQDAPVISGWESAPIVGGAEQPAPQAPSVLDRAKRVAGLGARAVGPQAAGALAGGAVGSIVPGVGTLAGAGAGATAATVAQLADRLMGTNSLDRLMDLLGLPKPETPTERVATDVTGAMAGMGGQLSLMRNLATPATGVAPTMGNRVADVLSQQPGRQLTATAMGQGAGSITREMGGDRWDQLTAQMAAGALPFASQMGARGITPETQRLRETAESGRNIGMSIPPADVNPTLVTRGSEWLGGGKQVYRDVASMKNAIAATNAAKADLGIPTNSALTVNRLQQIRTDAGAAYRGIENAGPYRTDAGFAQDIARLASNNARVLQQSPTAGNRQIRDIADELVGLNARDFDGRTVIALTQRLRELATQAFRGEDAGAGRFYRGASDAIENMVARNLAANRQGNILRDFQNARTTIAKTYTAEAALNDANATINPRILAQQFDRGNPISGRMSVVGRFSNAFPQATRPETAVGHPSLMSQFDVGLGMGAGGLGYLGGHPELGLLALARPTIRGFSMSPWGQSLMASPPTEINRLESLLRAAQSQVPVR